MDLVVVDNVCSLPMNPAVGEAVAEHLAGRPAVLRHHDLPWEREQYAGLTSWPPDDPAWRHVTINELARRDARAAAGDRGHHRLPRLRRAALPVAAGAGARRAGRGRAAGRWCCSRRGPSRARTSTSGLALAEALGGTYWLTGPAEDGFAGERSTA